ncbi:MAG: MFS transporter [Candidatus Microthrix sp.]|nr:MFS transporter [Candidatus Microthrix sp.]
MRWCSPVFLLTAGSFGDRFGRRRALLFGLVVFGAATLAASLAATPAPLIVCRGIMGFGAAFVMPSTLSVITSVFPPRERAKAIASFLARGVPDQLSDRCGCVGCGGAGRARESGPARHPAGSGRRRSVDADVGPVAVRHHRGPGTRLGQPAGGWHPGRRRGGRNPVRALRAACGAPDVGPQVFPDPGVLGIGADDHGGLLRHVWHVLHPVAVLPVRARLLALLAGIAQLPSAIVMVVLSPRSPAAVARIGVQDRVCRHGVDGGGSVGVRPGRPVDPYMVAMVALVLTATGMALTMPSTTAGLVGSLPAGKAGSRVGGQRHHPRGGWGAGHCRDGLGADVGVPGVAEPARPAAAAAADAARRSIGAALRGGRTCPGALGDPLAQAPWASLPRGIDAFYVAAAVTVWVRRVHLVPGHRRHRRTAGFHDRAQQVAVPPGASKDVTGAPLT